MRMKTILLLLASILAVCKCEKAIECLIENLHLSKLVGQIKNERSGFEVERIGNIMSHFDKTSKTCSFLTKIEEQMIYSLSKQVSLDRIVSNNMECSNALMNAVKKILIKNPTFKAVISKSVVLNELRRLGLDTSQVVKLCA